MKYNTYFLRTTDYDTLLQLGAHLGVVQLHYDNYEETERADGKIVRTPVGEPHVSANTYDEQGNPMYFGQFDFIGLIYNPILEEDVEPTAIADSEGTPYIHANLITTADIKELAINSTDPVIQEALDQITSFFVSDEEGNPKAPKVPHRVFA